MIRRLMLRRELTRLQGLGLSTATSLCQRSSTQACSPARFQAIHNHLLPCTSTARLYSTGQDSDSEDAAAATTAGQRGTVEPSQVGRETGPNGTQRPPNAKGMSVMERLGKVGSEAPNNNGRQIRDLFAQGKPDPTLRKLTTDLLDGADITRVEERTFIPMQSYSPSDIGKFIKDPERKKRDAEFEKEVEAKTKKRQAIAADETETDDSDADVEMMDDNDYTDSEELPTIGLDTSFTDSDENLSSDEELENNTIHEVKEPTFFRSAKANIPRYLDYRNPEFLSRFVGHAGRIEPRKVTRLPAKLQRQVARTVKLSRAMALLPYDVSLADSRLKYKAIHDAIDAEEELSTSEDESESELESDSEQDSDDDSEAGESDDEASDKESEPDEEDDDGEVNEHEELMEIFKEYQARRDAEVHDPEAEVTFLLNSRELFMTDKTKPIWEALDQQVEAMSFAASTRVAPYKGYKEENLDVIYRALLQAIGGPEKVRAAMPPKVTGGQEKEE